MATISLHLLTFNCARKLIQPHEFAPHIFEALPQHVSVPDVVVLSLQEIAPIAYSFLGGSFLTPCFSAAREAVRQAAKDHVNVVSHHLGMTAIMIFVKDPSKISSVETAGVGVGVQEMGNKGAVAVRLVYAETPLTIVAAHLAPMEGGVLRRNEDWKNIVKGLVFTRETRAAGGEQEEDVPLLGSLYHEDDSEAGIYNPKWHLFVAGDLNYRVSNTKPAATDFKSFPQPTDKMDNPNHFLNLLKNDQLIQQLQKGRTLQGFTEAEINFPPTYKLLKNDDPDYWNWASHRWPSWCDRILFLDTPEWMEEKIAVHRYGVLPQVDTSDHRPVVLSLSVPCGAIPEPAKDDDDTRLHPPFEIQPEWKSRRAVARKKEIVVGIAAYLILTWEGNALLAATVLGTAAGWFLIRSLLVV